MNAIKELIEYEGGLERIDDLIIDELKQFKNLKTIDFISVCKIKSFASLILEDNCKQLWFIDYFVDAKRKEGFSGTYVEQKAKILIDFLNSEYNLEKDNTVYLIIGNNVASIHVKPHMELK